ncbi:cell surface lipoprotein [Methanosarcina hadiensis]|uniref:cell surface lipoprotein n=1 Tax=Methanosarcina hadiensis TaxID=3078083 RepID=UPI003977619E
MKGKILVLLLVFVFLFASGCAEEEDSAAEEPDASEASAQPQENVPQENATSGSGKEHIVRLEYYNVSRPSELDIKTGDTVSWWSGKRQGNYVLVSEDGLFSEQKLAYSVPYSYTFTAPGTYLFTVKDVPAMNITIRVS